MALLDNLFNYGKPSKDPIKPFFTVKDKPEAQLSKWLTSTFSNLLAVNKDKIREMRENVALYKGDIHFNKTFGTHGANPTNAEAAREDGANDSRLYVNKVFDEIEYRVNKLTQNKPSISVGPTNTDHEDRVAAKAAKAFIDSIFYENDFDKLDREFEKNKNVKGEHFLAILWDPTKGDLIPAAKELKERGELSDDEEKLVYEGDLHFKHLPADRVLPEWRPDYEGINYLFFYELEDIEYLKVKYPEAGEKLKGKPVLSEYDDVLSETLSQELEKLNKTIKVTFWHRKTPECKEGAEICFTLDGTILENKDLPYSHGKIPVIRDTDIDIPDEQRGRAWIQNIKGMQLQHYFLSSMIVTNARLFSYPKWLVQKGTVNVKNLANLRTVLEYLGNQPPALLQPNSTPVETYNQIAKLESDIRESGRGAFSTPEGLPARLDSYVGIQFLFEQDQQRFNNSVAKRNRRLIEIAQMALSVAGDFYDEADGRLVKIVGKNQEPDIKAFNFANFNKPYDIRIEASSSLPDSKAAKMSTIMELGKTFPDAFTKEQIFDLLDLGNTDKMYNTQTRALKAAESIVQDILMGQSVPPPEGYEDLMPYWTVFSGEIQERKFKDTTPPEIRQVVLDYLGVIEMLMFQKAQKNPAFAQQLALLPQFPLVYVLPPSPEEVAAMEAEAMAQAQAEEQMMSEAEVLDTAIMAEEAALQENT